MSTLFMLVIAIVAVAGLVYGRGLLRPQAKSTLITEVVKKAALDISVTERGNLESSANVTLLSKVEGQAAIIKIVEEGTAVKKGDLLVEIDSAKLRNDYTQQEIVLKNAEAAEKQAALNKEIQETQNDSDIANAKLKLELAELDLEKYKAEGGDYEQLKSTINSEITLCNEATTRAQDQYDFTKRQAKKGYVTQTKLEGDRIAITKAELELKLAMGKLDLLEKYDQKRQITEKEANAKEFVREVERVKSKAKAALTQCEAIHGAAVLAAKIEKGKYDRMFAQIEACKIIAPQDGLVVYANEQSSRGGGGSQAAMIMEGAMVRERQAIINLPDVSKMRVNARIHESKIDMIKEGLAVRIKVDARPGEVFNGNVDNVSLTPLSANWPNTSLKEYSTTIAIQGDSTNAKSLKPGLTAEVEILVQRLESVLQVPIQAIVEQAGKHFAFVLAENKVSRRQTLIGKTNDVMMEIQDGLSEGEHVVLNPRGVLSKEIAELEAEFPASALPAAAKFGEEKAAKPPKARKGAPGSSGSADPNATDPAVAAKKSKASQGKGKTLGDDPVAFIQQFDTDGDGKLSESELPTFMKPRFAQIDTNSDKFIDQSEVAAMPRGGPGGGGRAAGAGGGGRSQPGGAL